MIGVTVTQEETNTPAEGEGADGAVAVDVSADTASSTASGAAVAGVDRPRPRASRRPSSAEGESCTPPRVEEAEEDAFDEVEDEPYVVSPFDQPGSWYVVHTYAGYENKVKSNLHSRTASMNMEDRIYEVVIPMEDVVEFKNGKKVVVQKKVFPGYLLCRCELDDDSWSVIRNTPGVTGFVGPGPSPHRCPAARSRESSR